MVAVKLAVNQMQIGMGTGADHPAVVTMTAGRAKLIDPYVGGLALIQCALFRRLTKKKLCDCGCEHFLADTVGAMQHVRVRNPPQRQRTLNPLLGGALVFDLNQGHELTPLRCGQRRSPRRRRR